MVDLDSDRLLRALDRLPLPLVLLRADAATGELAVAYASAQGRAFFGAELGAGQPLAAAWPGLSAARRAVLLDLYQRGEAADLTAPGGAAGAPARQFRAEPSTGPDGRVEGLLLTGMPAPAAPTRAVPAAPPIPYPPAAPQPAALPLITFYLADDGQRTEYLSPQWFAYTGQPPTTLNLDAAWAVALHPDDLAGLFFTFGPALEARQPWAGEVRLRRHDGEYRWHLSQAAPELDEAGQVRRWVGLSLDIHEQHTVWEHLRRREAQVRRLVEAIPQLVWTADAHGGITWVSEQWTRYTGLPLARSAGAGWLTAMHPDDRRPAADYWMSTVLAGTDAELNFRLREAASGRYRWFVTRAQVQHDERGRPTGWFGTATDMHELHETREQLQAKDQLLSQILGQVPAVVATLAGPAHRFTFSNPGYDELVGHRARLNCPVAECLPEVVAQGFIELLDNVYRTGETYVSHEAPIELRDASGELRQRFLDFTYQPLRDGRGQISGTLVFVVDVTAQVRARQRADGLQVALRRQDERLRTMTEALPQITYIVTRDFLIEYVSPQWYAYTGQAPGTITAESWAEFVHPDDLARVRDELARHMADATPWRYEHRLRRHDGQYRWHLSQGVPEPTADPAARPVRWYGSDTDIHELRELQEELRRGQARYRALTDQIPRQVWTANRAGVLDYFNERAAAYLGRELRQLAPAGWLEIIHSDDRARTLARWWEAVAHARPYAAELRLRRHDGAYRWHLSEATPELDETGQVRRWYGTNTDIDEQRELEQTLRRSEEQFRFLAESLPQIVWTSTGVGGNDYINQRWFDYTGLSAAVAGDKSNWPAVIHPDDLAPTNARWAQSVATGAFFEMEYRFRRHDGVYRWFLGQGRAQRRPDGSVVKWFGTCTDIEDQKQARQQLEAQNEQLRQTNHDLDQFVYTASHDLRQPINNMAGIFEELTRTAYFRDPDAVLLIDMFEKALRQIDDTIEDLTAIVQVQRRQQPVPTQLVALAPLSQEVIGSLQPQIAALGARIELDFAACPAVPFVRAQLQSVLFNLLGNALKYAAPGRLPLVRLRTARDPADQHPILSVQDNGLGLDLARHGGQLFQLFSRFHPQVEGSGMGLYLVNRILESHGGRIEVQSQVGEGTTFTLHLPAGGG